MAKENWLRYGLAQTFALFTGRKGSKGTGLAVKGRK